MLLTQGPLAPGSMLTGLLDQVGPDLRGVRIAVAYANETGVDDITARIEKKAKKAWEAADKRFITSLDFGLTDPAAVKTLGGRPNAEVRLAGSLAPPYIPTGSAFHPKMYLFDYDAHIRLLVGSPNLTRRGFSTNVEGAVIDVLQREQADAMWAATDVRGASEARRSPRPDPRRPGRHEGLRGRRGRRCVAPLVGGASVRSGACRAAAGTPRP